MESLVANKTHETEKSWFSRPKAILLVRMCNRLESIMLSIIWEKLQAKSI